MRLVRDYHWTQGIMDGDEFTILAPVQNRPPRPPRLHEIQELNLGPEVAASWPANEASLRRQ